MSDKKMAAIDKKIDKHMQVIKKERDKLDNLISEMEMYRETCDEAFCSLQEARDSLSNFV